MSGRPPASAECHVLVVDDDRRMAATLADIFRFKGYQVTVANSGAEALQEMDSGDLDCVLSDIKMPGMNGVELYREIKRRRPYLPVLLLTAYSSDSLVQEGLDAGAIAALTKPVEVARLLDFLESLIKTRSIAIVDDDLAFSGTLARTLHDQGYRVTQISDPNAPADRVAAAGQTLLMALKSNDPDNWQAVQEIRGRYPDRPVILMGGSGREMAETAAAARQLGAQAYLDKPLDVAALLELLARVRRRELRQVLGIGTNSNDPFASKQRGEQ